MQKLSRNRENIIKNRESERTNAIQCKERETGREEKRENHVWAGETR